MLAMVDNEVPFDQGQEQRRRLADLTVTPKAVERTAEAIGEDIASRQDAEVRRALQGSWPLAAREPIPVLYVQREGTGVAAVRAETEARAGKIEGQPAHPREAKLGCVFTQSGVDEEGHPVRDAASSSLHRSCRKGFARKRIILRRMPTVCATQGFDTSTCLWARG